MQLKAMKFLTSVLLGGFYAASSLAAAQEIKYAAIQKEDDKWKVVSVSDNVPTYQEGMEILSLPQFAPQYDNRFKWVRSQYGGIECPSVPDKTMYTPCNSYFYRFVGANWFGLGGIRVGFIQDRLAEVKTAISSDETVAAIKAKADEAADAQAQAAREAERVRNAKAQERAREENEAYQSLVAANLEKMAKMDRGVEDSCKRIMKTTAGPGGSWFIGAKDPESAQIKCQFGGEISLQGLAGAGWLVVNKIKDSDGIVTEYYIRKAR